MKLKVIKAIKGLVPGDVLEYNENKTAYEIYKVEEDLGDKKSTRNTLKISIDEWLVKDYLDYFSYIDNDGSSIKIEEFEYPNSNKVVEDNEKIIKLNDDIAIWQSECIKLSNRIQELEKVLDQYKHSKINEYTVNYPDQLGTFLCQHYKPYRIYLD